MNKFKFAFQTFALVALVFAFSAIANAQATRTWVSGVGDDVNPCSRTAPCKTFAGAISKTATNGEINCLDPAGYGAVTITKSITIDCEDTQGSILSSGTNGIIVNITSVTDTAKTFRLRGISINGASTGINGIRILAANKVFVEDSVLDGFTTHGISVETSSGNLTLSLEDVQIRNAAGNGINTFLTGTATANISITNSLIAGCNVGYNQGAAVDGTIQFSTVTGNTTGVQASSSNSTLGVKDTVVSHNTTGVSALSSATIRIGSNMITANGTGLSGTNIFTWGGNFVDGNTVNGTNNGNALVQ